MPWPPLVETVRDDRDHGSAWVAGCALSALRDRAADAPDLATVAAFARDLRDARPDTAAVANRVNRAMAGAETPGEVQETAVSVLHGAARADTRAATVAASLLDGPVATLSRSGTVLAALRETTAPVVVGESRLGREGVATAEALGDRATLVSDALAARDAGVPVRVVAARDKVLATGPAPPGEPSSEPSAALYDGTAPVATATPLFERVPARLVDAVVTERGVLDAADVRSVAADHRAAAAWDEEY